MHHGSAVAPPERNPVKREVIRTTDQLSLRRSEMFIAARPPKRRRSVGATCFLDQLLDELKNIFLFKFNFELAKQRQILVLERFATMVFLLILYVADYHVEL